MATALPRLTAADTHCRRYNLRPTFSQLDLVEISKGSGIHIGRNAAKTLQLLSKNHSWKYCFRKLLQTVLEYLADHSAKGKKGSAFVVTLFFMGSCNASAKVQGIVLPLVPSLPKSPLPLEQRSGWYQDGHTSASSYAPSLPPPPRLL